MRVWGSVFSESSGRLKPVMALQPIPLFKVFMAPPEELDIPVTSVLHSGFVTQGPKVEEFEEMLRRFFGNPRVVTLNSATSGLQLALHLLMKPDKGWPGMMEQVDEVLTCPLTCTASNWPILANRLRIKWVDADPVTCGMCLDDLEAKLSPTTKVIMVVHWGGTPIDLDRIARIQQVRGGRRRVPPSASWGLTPTSPSAAQVCFEKYGFRPQVIEDCAHAFGAEHKQLKLGNHGNLCVFSLQVRVHGCVHCRLCSPLWRHRLLGDKCTHEATIMRVSSAAHSRQLHDPPGARRSSTSPRATGACSCYPTLLCTNAPSSSAGSALTATGGLLDPVRSHGGGGRGPCRLHARCPLRGARG